MDSVMWFKLINIFGLGAILFMTLIRPFYHVYGIKKKLSDIIITIVVYTLYADVVYLVASAFVIFARWVLY